MCLIVDLKFDAGEYWISLINSKAFILSLTCAASLKLPAKGSGTRNFAGSFNAIYAFLSHCSRVNAFVYAVRIARSEKLAHWKNPKDS